MEAAMRSAFEKNTKVISRSDAGQAARPGLAERRPPSPRRLPQQLAVRPDHGEIDHAPAVPRLGRVVHVHAAQVELAHVVERLENLLARRLGARALERLGGALADD